MSNQILKPFFDRAGAICRVWGPDVTFINMVLITFFLQFTVGYWCSCMGLFNVFYIAATVGRVSWIPIHWYYNSIDHISTKINEAIEITADKTQKVISKTVNEGLSVISSAVAGEGITFSSISKSFNEHPIGISTCVTSIAKSEDIMGVGTEIIKIGSLLGMEKSLLSSVFSSISRSTLTVAPTIPIAQQSLEECIPLFSAVASVAGTDLGVGDFTTYLSRYANNIKHSKVIVDHVRELGETMGIIKPKGFEQLTECADELSALREEYDWVLLRLATNASVFGLPLESQRLGAFKKRIMSLSDKLNRIKTSKFGNNKIFQDCQLLVGKAQEAIAQIAVIVASSGTRIKPIGVNFYGQSNIGKTPMVAYFINKVKQELLNYPELFPNASQWLTWNYQDRDEFDTGYHGQDIMYVDDGWKRKDCSDHAMFYTFISSARIGTIQAQLAQKGSPFEAKLVVVTSNQLPTTSTTMEDISALHNRFPVTVHCQMKPGRTIPNEPDPEFTWLEFAASRMQEQINGLGNREHIPTIDPIVQDVVRRMVHEATLHVHAVQVETQAEQLRNLYTAENLARTPIPIEQQVGSPVLFRPSSNPSNLMSPCDMAEDAELLAYAEDPTWEPELEVLEEDRVDTPPHINELQHLTEAIMTPRQPESTRVYSPNRQTRYQNSSNISNVLPSNGTHITLDDNELNCVAEELAALDERAHIHSVTQLRNWWKYLRRKTDQRTFMQIWTEGADQTFLDPFNFLATLGIWEVDPDFTRNFFELWEEQPIVVVTDHLETNYVWSPRILRGSRMILDTPDLRTLSVQFRRTMTANGAELELFLEEALASGTITQEEVDHLRASQTASITERIRLALTRAWWARLGRQAFRFVLWTGFLGMAIITDQVRYVFYATLVTPSALGFRNRFRGMMGGIRDMITLPVWVPGAISASIFDRLQAWTEWVREKFIDVIISALELLGINITDIVRTITDQFSCVVIDAAILSLVAIVAYGCYRIYQYLSKKDGIDQQKQSKYDDQQGGKKSRVTHAGRRIPIRQQHIKCKDPCEPTKMSTDFHIISKCNDYLLESNSIVSYINQVVDEGQVDDFSLTITNVNLVEDTGEHLKGCYRKAEPVRFEGVKASVERTFYTTQGKSNPCLTIEKSFVTTIAKVAEDVQNVLKHFKTVGRFLLHLDISIVPDTDIVHINIYLDCINELINGIERIWTRRSVSEILGLLPVLREEVKQLPPKPKNVLLGLEISHQATQEINAILNRHQVFIGDCKYGPDNPPACSLHGLGHKNYIIFPAHLVQQVNVLVKFWRGSVNKHARTYQLALVTDRNVSRDVAFARILTKSEAFSVIQSLGYTDILNEMNPACEGFSDLTSHLVSYQTLLQITQSSPAWNYLPTNEVTIATTVTHIGDRNYFLSNGQGRQTYDYLEITGLNTLSEVSVNGDCGGCVVSRSKGYTDKIIGQHAAVTTNKKIWRSSYLVQEDLAEISQQRKEDPWVNLIVEGKPIDLPPGGACTFKGIYTGSNKPVGRMELDHWHDSPFAHEFEKQLEEAPLNPHDPRIERELGCNARGQKSLIIDLNSKLCEVIPTPDINILLSAKEKIVNDLSDKMDFKSLPSDVDELIDLGLNGDLNNKYVGSVHINAASGLPWSDLGAPLKSDMLNKDEHTGKVTFHNTELGKMLRDRVKMKLLLGNQGQRLISLYATKLKDAPIKLKHVKNGRGRTFQCAPVEKVLTDTALFGRFKEAFTALGLDAAHAVGTNVHSMDWTIIAEKLRKHPNFCDADYSNYDRRIHQLILQIAYEIIIEVIQRNAPDVWAEARRVLADEAIRSYIVDYLTVYMTERGNKSGDYLTTIINCIVNWIHAFYVWVIVTGIDDWYIFTLNVEVCSFGDDIIMSVSDEFKHFFNYFTIKEVLSGIGHTITPGCKSEIESEFVPFEELQFLKRTFVKYENIYLPRLIKTSIESPFVRTRLLDTDLDIWYNLIHEQLYEASLWGEDYYNEFVNKLRKCNNKTLLRHISPMINRTYSNVFDEYIVKYKLGTHVQL